MWEEAYNLYFLVSAIGSEHIDSSARFNRRIKALGHIKLNGRRYQTQQTGLTQEEPQRQLPNGNHRYPLVPQHQLVCHI